MPIEEAFRGEPQTPVIARLRVYQWMALGGIVAGALLTALRRSAAPPAPQLSMMSLFPALAFGTTGVKSSIATGQAHAPPALFHEVPRWIDSKMN